jgi:SPP1 family predicted phage head-tail adaptor
MDKRVVIQTATAATNDFGEAVETWADGDTVWAALDPAGGGESWQASQLIGEATHKVTIRWRVLTHKQRFKYGTRIFEITRIDNPAERNERLEVYCTERRE